MRRCVSLTVTKTDNEIKIIKELGGTDGPGKNFFSISDNDDGSVSMTALVGDTPEEGKLKFAQVVTEMVKERESFALTPSWCGLDKALKDVLFTDADDVVLKL